MKNLKHKAIRQRCLAERKELANDFQFQCAERIYTQLLSLNAYQNAQTVAFFYALNGEIDLTALWQGALAQGKRCFFPVVHTHKRLLFLPVSKDTPFSPNQYGILEPHVTPQEAISPEDIDIMFAPLVAFDTQCHRIGMGKGFYDFTLANAKPKLLMGVAYEFQKQSGIEPNPWDILLDAVITENTIYWSAL